MGPLKVRQALEDLVSHCHQLAPGLAIAYANFPTTEYLEPRNADFTAFNVYLENQADFQRYLSRLHNIAGDRPLLLTEFGFNTWSEGAHNGSDSTLEHQQAEMLTWAKQTSLQEATAGFTTYSWSDRWFNGGVEVTDWSFGLNRRDGSAKPALTALTNNSTQTSKPPSAPPLFTVAICTRNGGLRLQENLPFFEHIEDPNFELLIIDDGSSDDTCKKVTAILDQIPLNSRILSQAPSGLSAARNHAAREGRGEFIVYIDDDARPHRKWLHYLRLAFHQNPIAAAAGAVSYTHLTLSTNREV